MAKAITNSQATVSMANCDDSIAEIDAMIPRLLRMKKQLMTQKEYIEVALKDANDFGNTNAANAVDKATNQNAKIVDFRANLYKHQQKIQRLNSSTPENGTLVTDDTTDSDRAKKMVVVEVIYLIHPKKRQMEPILKKNRQLIFLTALTL